MLLRGKVAAGAEEVGYYSFLADLVQIPLVQQGVQCTQLNLAYKLDKKFETRRIYTASMGPRALPPKIWI